MGEIGVIVRPSLKGPSAFSQGWSPVAGATVTTWWQTEVVVTESVACKAYHLYYVAFYKRSLLTLPQGV